ncbi:hypothetical protein [uncultured phage MedDCM-OCT-S08-C41]|uniref:Uncharacterized protein n=1 Tax=uncultured phage MedDCM-OCT-S08-C41 TaxID=743578 RepID=D6PID8_9CAUD|nr:hypothetical protein HOT88_gp13 [uncultured phage MedDCM-OCT-S08-C41]ADD95489.1 hypothetical protein [uncultured phage MedDCM-OCT-S08-C41]
MCIASLLGFKPPKPPDPPKLPPIVKQAPQQPKEAPAPQSLQGEDDKKPKVDFAKKMSTTKAKRVGASDLKIPLQQNASGGSTGGLNV